MGFCCLLFCFLPYCPRATTPSQKLARKESRNSMGWMTYSSLLLKTMCVSQFVKARYVPCSLIPFDSWKESVIQKQHLIFQENILSMLQNPLKKWIQIMPHIFWRWALRKWIFYWFLLFLLLTSLQPCTLVRDEF